MNFFFDANLSCRIADAIAAIHGDYHKIVHITKHDDFINNNKYSNNGKTIGNVTADIEWIKKLASSGTDWKLISGDMDIIDTAHERAVLMESRLTFFVCDHNWENLAASEQAWKFMKLWDEIVRNAKTPTPALYRFLTGKKLCVEIIRGGMRARGGRFKG